MRILVLLITAVLILLIAAGCGGGSGQMIPLTIEITDRDGSPLAGVRVTMREVEVGRTARGVSDDDGQCAMGTFATGDGVLAGNYQVAITERVVPRDDPSANPTKVRVPWRYASFDRSGIELKITPDSERLIELQLEAR